MINWRSGKAGFVGASKYLIKGVLECSYSVTSVNLIWTVQTPDATSWSDQTADTTIWTDQTPDSSVWTDQ